MTKASKTVLGAVSFFLVSLFVVLVAAMAAVSPATDVRAFGLAVLSTAILGSLLVAYLDWRSRTRRRFIAGDDERRRVA